MGREKDENKKAVGERERMEDREGDKQKRRRKRRKMKAACKENAVKC